jgi:hypothetical protein
MWREGGSLNPENRVQLPDGTLIGRIDAGGRDAIQAYLASQSVLGAQSEPAPSAEPDTH